MTSSDKKETVVMHVEKVGYMEVDLKRRKKNSTSFGQKIKSYYVVSIQQLP